MKDDTRIQPLKTEAFLVKKFEKKNNSIYKNDSAFWTRWNTLMAYNSGRLRSVEGGHSLKYHR